MRATRMAVWLGGAVAVSGCGKTVRTECSSLLPLDFVGMELQYALTDDAGGKGTRAYLGEGDFDGQTAWLEEEVLDAGDGFEVVTLSGYTCDKEGVWSLGFDQVLRDEHGPVAESTLRWDPPLRAFPSQPWVGDRWIGSSTVTVTTDGDGLDDGGGTIDWKTTTEVTRADTQDIDGVTVDVLTLTVSGGVVDDPVSQHGLGVGLVRDSTRRLLSFED